MYACIAYENDIVFYSKTNQMHFVSNLFYFTLE